MNLRNLSSDIEVWFAENKRLLPWRVNPSPYKSLLAEIMLQQTRITAVIPSYNRFIEVVPGFKELANLDDEKLRELWQGLGYYRRANNLRACAKEIINKHNGKIPSDQKELLSLPGIGEYTAGAILSMVYDLPYGALDGNLKRVIARLFEIEDPLNKTQDKKECKRHLDLLIDNCSSPAKLNEGLMELGERICIPGKPKCNSCPLKSHCIAFKNSKTVNIPKAKEKKPFREENAIAWLSIENDKIFMERLKKGQWNEGQLSIPFFHYRNCEDLSSRETAEMLFTIKHGITNHKFTILCYRKEKPEADLEGEYYDLKNLPAISTITKKALSRLTQQKGRLFH